VQDTGCVILINHQSMVDLLGLAEIWPVMQRCTVISKKAIFYLWPFGLASWLWGTVFIDRLNVQQAKSTINETAAAINGRKAKICFFPEGTRHCGDDLLSFKKGAFHVAVDLQCPIQPVVISRYYFLDWKNRIFDSGKAIMEILPPISTVGLGKDDMDDLIANVYKRMNDKYKELSEEALAQSNEDFQARQ